MQLDGYTDLTRLSQGGMATIYQGRQTSLNRVVAIKFLSAEYLWDEQATQMFEQESLVIAQLNHPNIIHIIDRGISDKGRPYFVMEYVEGQDLSELMIKGGMSLTQKVDLIMQACKGLAFAHKNGVVHRDIKPANLLVDPEGNLKVLDFGIAWLNSKGAPDGEEVLGTPDYMSPEQLNEPGKISHLSDIYAISSVMYHLAIGRTQTADFKTWRKSLEILPGKLGELISQCLASDPAKRPQSADEVRLRLLRMVKGAHLHESQKREAKTVVGRIMDKFVLLDIIKRNRFGAVYLFEDKSRRQLMVVKKRVKSLKGYREAQLLVHTKHPNIIRVFGTSKNDNAFIVVMQHMSGGSLQDRLSRPYRGNEFVEVALQICKGMSSAHHHNAIHSNLRPSNILFDDKGHIRITDFGLDEHSSTGKRDWYQPLINEEPSVERDVYSAAAIFHHMLTGEPLKFEHRRLKPGAAFNRLDPRLQALLRNMLEYDKSDYLSRFDMIISVLKSLQGSMVDPDNIAPIKRKKKTWPWLLAPLAAVPAAAGFLYLNPEQLITVRQWIHALLLIVYDLFVA